MNRASVQVLIWGVYLTALTVILWIWWGDWLSVLQLGAAAVIVALVAAWFVVVHGRPPASEERVLPDISVGAALVGISLCGMLFGAEFGLFLVIICAGLLLLGLGRLAIELYAERQRH